jgi:hypothetical protein
MNRSTFLALLPVVLYGCGSGSNFRGGKRGVGGARFSVKWPARTGRLIPRASQSIQVVLSDEAGRPVATRTLVSPGNGGTTNAQIDDLPVGRYRAEVTGRPAPDGTGVAQSRAFVSFDIGEGQLVNTPVTMDSTIVRSGILFENYSRPDGPGRIDSQSSDVAYPVSFDADDNIVLTDQEDWEFRASNDEPGQGPPSTTNRFPVTAATGGVILREKATGRVIQRTVTQVINSLEDCEWPMHNSFHTNGDQRFRSRGLSSYLEERDPPILPQITMIPVGYCCSQILSDATPGTGGLGRVDGSYYVVVVQGSSSVLKKLDSNFVEIASKPLPGISHLTPVLTSAKDIIVAMDSGVICCFDRDNFSLNWKRELNSKIVSPLSMDSNISGSVIVVTENVIYNISGTNGSIKSRFVADNYKFSTSAIIFDEGTSALVVGNSNGQIIGLQSPENLKLTSIQRPFASLEDSSEITYLSFLTESYGSFLAGTKAGNVGVFGEALGFFSVHSDVGSIKNISHSFVPSQATTHLAILGERGLRFGSLQAGQPFLISEIPQASGVPSLFYSDLQGTSRVMRVIFDNKFMIFRYFENNFSEPSLIMDTNAITTEKPTFCLADGPILVPTTQGILKIQ